MNEYKYKVLWLDDDFEPISSETNIDENRTRKGFQDDVEMAADYGIEVVGVSNYEDFCNEVKNLQSFQAVIFDLKGMEKGGEISDNVMPDAMDILKRNRDLPVFVYSANNQSEKFEITLRNIEKEGRSFFKGFGVEPLYEKILEVLDENLHYYNGHKECLLLFSKSYLNTTNRDKMDELLKMYEAKEKTYAPYNNMRHILEDMLKTLVDIGLIDYALREQGFDPKMKYLTEKVNPLRDGNGNAITKDGKPQWDFNNPVVPYSICPREIKYVLHYLGDMTNWYSHFLATEPDYLKQGESVLEYNIMIQQSVYYGFFVAMKWFYSYMEKNYSKNNSK